MKTQRNQSNFIPWKKKKYFYKLLPPIIIGSAILTATNQNPKIISGSQLPVVGTLFSVVIVAAQQSFWYVRIRRHIKP